MPRLIWVFTGRTVILLVLSWGGSNSIWFRLWTDASVIKMLATATYMDSFFARTCKATLRHKNTINEPRHDKTNNVAVRPAKTQISLGIRPVLSGSSLSAWRKLGSSATHWAHSEDSDQIWRMARLIWVFAGRTLILLVLSCRASNSGYHPDGWAESWLTESKILVLHMYKNHSAWQSHKCARQSHNWATLIYIRIRAFHKPNTENCVVQWLGPFFELPIYVIYMNGMRFRNFRTSMQTYNVCEQRRLWYACADAHLSFRHSIRSRPTYFSLFFWDVSTPMADETVRWYYEETWENWYNAFDRDRRHTNDRETRHFETRWNTQRYENQDCFDDMKKYTCIR